MSEVPKLYFLGVPGIQDVGAATLETLAGLRGAFLVYVFLSPRPVRRSHLAELFWPGPDRARGLHSLRQMLSVLRGQLDPNPLAIGSESVSWRHGLLHIDLALWQEAVAARRPDEAVELWRGDFLEGFQRPESWELQEWVESKRSLFQGQMVSLATSAIHERLEAFDVHSAVQLAERAARRFPLEPELISLHIESLAAAGDGERSRQLLTMRRDLLPPDLIEIATDAVERARRVEAPKVQSIPKEQAATVPSNVPDNERRGRGARDRASRRDRVSAFALPGAAIVLLAFQVVWTQGTRTDRDGEGLAEPTPAWDILLCADWTAPGVVQAFRMSPDGRNKHRVTVDPACSFWQLPDGSLVAGVAGGPEGPGRLALYRADPTNPIAEWTRSWIATDLSDPWFGLESPVLPDGRLVVSAVDGQGQRDLFMVDPIQDSVQRLTDDPFVEGGAAIDAGGEGTFLVFTRYLARGETTAETRAGGGGLFELELTQGTVRRLTADTPLAEQAIVRGDSVIFVRGLGVGPEDGSLEIVLLDRESGSETSLTNNDWNDYLPALSSDGRWLCWQSEEFGHFEMDIMVMDLHSGEVRRAVAEMGRDSECVWSPDATQLVFRSWRSGSPSIYVMPTQGDDPVQLTRQPGAVGIARGFLREIGAVRFPARTPPVE